MDLTRISCLRHTTGAFEKRKNCKSGCVIRLLFLWGGGSESSEISFYKRDCCDSRREIARLGLCVDAEKVDVIMPDPKDRVFYEVVMEERKRDDAYLVTGNLNHFSEEPFVVTPRQMLEIIAQEVEE